MVELYSHNKVTYEKVKSTLACSDKVLITQATSTGKSFITMKLMQEDYKDYKKLYVVPKIAIKDNLTLYPEWVEHNVDFITYAKLTRVDIEEIISSYDVFIFDEVHHAGARLWRKPVESILLSGKVCIGLTATPLRTDGIDIGKLLFEGYVVAGPDVATAINEHIWSDFKYVLTVNKIRERLEAAKKKVEDLPASVDTLNIKTESAGYALTDASSYTVRNIVEANNNTVYPKWLVFCSSISQMNEIDDDINDWFQYDRPTILKVDSTMSKSDISKIIYKFNVYTNTKPIVLVSVNILSEGMHLSGVTGMILLRHTESLPMFLQMIGRVMTTNNNIVPVIVDVADNLTMLRRVVSSMAGKEDIIVKDSDIGKCKAKPEVIITKELSIQLELLISMEEFVESIEALDTSTFWSDYELKVLRRYWPDVYSRISKPKAAIRKKAAELGLIQKVTWTVQEDEVLKSQYPFIGMNVCKSLTGKSRSGIRNRVRQLNIKYKNRWSFDEDTMVLRGEIPEGRTEEECKDRKIKLERRLL